MPAFPAVFADWQYRAPLTYVASYVGSGGVTNFPFLVPWTTAPEELWSGAQADGSDLRLTGTDGETETNFELVSFTPGSAAMETWGLGASISSAADTSLGYVYWGNASASAKPAAWGQGVWTAGSWVTVYHLNESAYTGGIADATGNGNTATGTGTVSAGLIGNCSGGLPNFTAPDSSSLDFGGNAVTLYAWVKPTSSNAPALVMGKNYRDAVHVSPFYVYGYGLWDGGHFRLSADTLNFYCGLSTTKWNLFCAIYDGAFMRLYVDGVQKASVAKTITIDASRDGTFRIGRTYANEQFSGLMDELRVASMAKSTAELLTSYNNQLTPALTIEWGDVEENAGGGGRRSMFTGGRMFPGTGIWTGGGLVLP